MEAAADATGNCTLSRRIHLACRGGHLTVSYAACKTVVEDCRNPNPPQSTANGLHVPGAAPGGAPTPLTISQLGAVVFPKTGEIRGFLRRRFRKRRPSVETGVRPQVRPVERIEKISACHRVSLSAAKVPILDVGVASVNGRQRGGLTPAAIR